MNDDEERSETDRYSVNMATHPFVAAEDEDEIYNILTQEVMTEKVSKDVLEGYEIGQRMFVEFATTRLTEG